MRAIRRAVFATLDAAERRANRKGSERLLRLQECTKHQVCSRRALLRREQ